MKIAIQKPYTRVFRTSQNSGSCSGPRILEAEAGRV